jgi:hypothetical protein
MDARNLGSFKRPAAIDFSIEIYFGNPATVRSKRDRKKKKLPVLSSMQVQAKLLFSIPHFLLFAPRNAGRFWAGRNWTGEQQRKTMPSSYLETM